jgi:hypothetical protein
MGADCRGVAAHFLASSPQYARIEILSASGFDETQLRPTFPDGSALQRKKFELRS